MRSSSKLWYASWNRSRFDTFILASGWLTRHLFALQVISTADLVHFQPSKLPINTSGGKEAFISRAVEAAADLREDERREKAVAVPQVAGGTYSHMHAAIQMRTLPLLPFTGLSHEDFTRQLREAVLGKGSDDIATVEVDLHAKLAAAGLPDMPHCCLPPSTPLAAANHGSPVYVIFCRCCCEPPCHSVAQSERQRHSCPFCVSGMSRALTVHCVMQHAPLVCFIPGDDRLPANVGRLWHSTEQREAQALDAAMDSRLS